MGKSSCVRTHTCVSCITNRALNSKPLFYSQHFSCTRHSCTTSLSVRFALCLTFIVRLAAATQNLVFTTSPLGNSNKPTAAASFSFPVQPVMYLSAPKGESPGFALSLSTLLRRLSGRKVADAKDMNCC